MIKLIRLLVIVCITTLTATAQSTEREFWTHYTHALEDSVRLFELLKPAYKELKIKTSLQEQESVTLRNYNDWLQRENTTLYTTIDSTTKQQKKQRRTAWLNGFGYGALTGSVIMAALLMW